MSLDNDASLFTVLLVLAILTVGVLTGYLTYHTLPVEVKEVLDAVRR